MLLDKPVAWGALAFLQLKAPLARPRQQLSLSLASGGSRRHVLNIRGGGALHSGAFDAAKGRVDASALAAANANGVKHTSAASPAPADSSKGIPFILLGSFAFSCMFFLVKLQAGVFSTFTMVTYRSLVQLVLATAAITATGDNLLGPRDPHVRLLLLLRGSFGAVAVGAFFFATQHLPLPDATTLQFTTPVFSGLVAVFLLGEPLRPLDLLGALVCTVGVLLIAQPPWLFNVGAATTATTAMAPLAVAAGLAGAVLSGTAYVLVRRIGTRASSTQNVAYYAATSLVIAPVASWLMGGGWNVLRVPAAAAAEPWRMACLLGMGLCGFAGQFFTNLGLQREKAATATLVANSQIVYSFAFEAFILHEAVRPLSVAGTALIMAYTIAVGVLRAREARQARQASKP